MEMHRVKVGIKYTNYWNEATPASSQYPKTSLDPDWTDPFDGKNPVEQWKSSTMCRDKHDMLFCTRDKGHSGRHLAGCGKNSEYPSNFYWAEWEDEYRTVLVLTHGEDGFFTSCVESKSDHMIGNAFRWMWKGAIQKLKLECFPELAQSEQEDHTPEPGDEDLLVGEDPIVEYHP